MEEAWGAYGGAVQAISSQLPRPLQDVPCCGEAHPVLLSTVWPGVIQDVMVPGPWGVQERRAMVGGIRNYIGESRSRTPTLALCVQCVLHTCAWVRSSCSQARTTHWVHAVIYSSSFFDSALSESQ